MRDLTTSLYNNVKLAVYTGGNIHEPYPYLEIIVTWNNLTYSGQISHHFGPSSSTNNDAATIQTVIADLHIRQEIICKRCGIIGHKAYACIKGGPKFLPPILRRNINQFNALHGDEPTNPPIERNSQPPEVYFKYSNSSAIMVILNHHAVNNGYVEFHPSDFPVESNSDSVADTDTTPIK